MLRLRLAVQRPVQHCRPKKDACPDLHCLPLCRPQVYRELAPLGLQALILDAAVWLCADDAVTHQLDTLCFGNLDGGAGTAAHVRAVLEGAGATVQPGDKAVRLSLDEAFFMAHALGLLTVHDLAEGGAAVPLDTTVGLRGFRLCLLDARGACAGAWLALRRGMRRSWRAVPF